MNKSLVTNLLALILLLVGRFSPYFSTQLTAMGLFAFSGAITNWLAIYMLFERVPGLYGSGVIPLHFQEFKKGIHNLVMEQFFTAENIERFLGGQGSGIDLGKIKEAVDYDLLFSKLVEAVMASPLGGMLAMFGGPGALDGVKPHFQQKIEEAMGEITQTDRFKAIFSAGGESGSILSSVDEIVQKRLEELTPQMVKEIIQKMIREHLGWLVVWGGVFGALIGLISTFF
jgi:uncharacterized membrane-anchored protein YjiN (DUF445 family)